MKPATSSYTSRYNSFQTPSSETQYSQKPSNVPDTIPTALPPDSSSFPVTEKERLQVRTEATKHANEYYDIVTRSYEAGWSTHFHFPPYAPTDTIEHALKFYVYRLALLMGLRPGMRVLDVGCGIGAPAREVAKLVGCTVVGITINQHQVDRAIHITATQGLGHLCTFVRGDFHELPFADESFDAVFACEATCHAESVRVVYGEARRVLKSGGVFGFTEEVLDDHFEDGAKVGKWDESVERFRDVRNRIEVGGGMPSLRTVTEVRQVLMDLGLVIEVDEDFARYFDRLSEAPALVYADDEVEGEKGARWNGRLVKSFSTVKIPFKGSEGFAPPPSATYLIESTEEEPIPPPLRPWHYPLWGTKEAVDLGVTAEDRQTVSAMLHRNRKFAYFMRRVYVRLGLSPAQLVQLNKMLELYVDGCVEAAKEGVFTPCWMFVCRKPLEATDIQVDSRPQE